MNILDEYKQLTGKDLTLFFQKTLSFFKTDYGKIVDYYSGKSKDSISTYLKNFTSLVQDKDQVFETFHSYSTQMNDSRWYDLLSEIEEIDNRLATLRKINKWTRSSVSTFGFQPSGNFNYSLQQGQSLENVSKLLGEASPDDWVDIAFDNNLGEEDYDVDGGNYLTLQTATSINPGIEINSVVDTIIGKSIYGKDCYRKIMFSLIDGDLTILGYDETILQAIDILIGMKKNDNPTRPEMGLQSTVVVGTSSSLLNFPIIIRQLNETFATDDSLKDFQVTSISREQDNLSVSYTVKTRLDEVLTNKVLV